MIVNIRGLSGSGKSTAVKNIINLYTDKEILMTRKKRALVTRLYNTHMLNECVVIGPYDDKNQTNGCDVIAFNEQAKLLIEYYDDRGYDVLFEGMMLSTNHTLIVDLAKTREVCVLFLDVDIDTIIKQRKQRAIDKNRDSNFKHDISVMNNDNITKSLEKIKNTIGEKCQFVKQNDILEKYIECICMQDIRSIIQETSQDKFDLSCRYDTITSNRNNKIKLPEDLFDVR